MKLKSALLLAIASAVLVGCSKKEPAAPEAPSYAGQKAAALEGLTYIKGDPVTFEAGNVYVVEFWATWCPPCRESIPHLTEVQTQLENKGVTVIGISNEEIDTVKAFVEKMNDDMDYTVAIDSEGKAGAGYMEAYKQKGIPTAFIVDGKGQIAWIGHPMDNLEGQLEKAIENTGQAAVETEPAPEVETPVATETETHAKEQTTTQDQIGQTAAPLDGLNYVKGKPVKFENGKVYVVEFWATWCPPCRESIPHLTEIQKKFKDKGVTVLGISNEGDVEKVKSFVTEKGDTMDYTVAVDPDRKVSDGYMKAFGQNGIPTAFIVDAAGKVVWVGHPMSDLDTVLESVAAGEFDAAVYAKAKIEREEAERRLSTLYQDYFKTVMNGGTVEQSRSIAEQLVTDGNADILNAFAWTILANLPEEKRDLPTALKVAEKANAQTNGQNAMVLDTYAMALFQNNNVAEAIQAQEKAIAQAAGNEAMQADMKIRLDMFKAALSQ